jgi:multidrug resistance efflux pump
MILIPLLIVVILLALVGAGGYFAYNNYMYYSTDDAKISGNLVGVSALANGKLTSSLTLGEKVNAGDTLGTIDPGSGTLVKIVSPISGTVISDSAVNGQFVTTGLQLAQLTDLNAITVTAYVDESAINNISVGQTVDVKVDAYSDTTLTGKVQQIVSSTAGSFSLLPTEDNASGNFTKVSQRIPVVITINGDAGKQLLPGMSTTVTIHTH